MWTMTRCCCSLAFHLITPTTNSHQGAPRTKPPNCRPQVVTLQLCHILTSVRGQRSNYDQVTFIFFILTPVCFQFI